jgi:hypothetical protein
MRSVSRSCFLVIALTLLLPAGSQAQQDWAEVDRQIDILQSSAREGSRLAAASWLSKELRRANTDQLRKLSQVLRSAGSERVRCAAAGIFASLGTQSRFHTGSRRPLADESAILNSLRQALIYEDKPAVRCCIIAAGAEFDSSEAQALIDRGKSDLSPAVRATSQAAEYRRRNRLTALGL